MANTSSGHFVWHEHLTKDAKAAIGFYTEVVGWKTQPFGAGDDEGYTMWVGSQGPLGGVMTLPDEAARMGAPPHWLGHVQVADVAATVALARKLGGKVYKEPTDVPTVGRFAILADPQGAVISVFTPSGDMAKHDTSKQGEVCWNELMTSDSPAAFTFYSQLFGWKVLEEMNMGPMGTYRIYGLGEERLGGMMDLPKGAPMPSAWMYYVDIVDLDAAIARATRRGAKVMNGPMDVPGGGRIAQLMDPQGAAFALHQSPKK
jgi:predicted enzyme related to lactoylglutathione lyase